MKKFILSLTLVLSVLLLVGCNSNQVFKPGKDTGEFIEETEYILVARDVFVEIVGADNDVLFSGKVHVEAVDPNAYMAIKGAVLTKQLSHTIDESNGWIQSIGNYVNGTNNAWWLGFLNGEDFTTTSTGMQIRSGDYIQIKFLIFE